MFGLFLGHVEISSAQLNTTRNSDQAAELPLFRMATVCLGKRLDEGWVCWKMLVL